jgi:uncharacterized protein YggE
MLFAIAAPCFLQAPALLAQDERREPVIQIAGEGQASVAPDTALVSLAVVRNAATADAALAANNAAMRDVLAFLRENGVADRDTQTSGFSIHPQYRQQEPKDGSVPPPEVVGYEVSNMLTVKVRELAKLGSLLDGSVKLGVNQGGQISFTKDKPEAVMADARKAAVADAMAKARTLAEAAGVKLGRILEISEGAPVVAPPPMMRMAMAKEMSDSVPIATGENTYSVTVNMTFALAQ